MKRHSAWGLATLWLGLAASPAHGVFVLECLKPLKILFAGARREPPGGLFAARDPELQQALKGMARKIRAERAAHLKAIWPTSPNVGSKIRHGELDLTVTQVLGMGNEGVVFVAQDAGAKEYVVKKFTDASQNTPSHVKWYLGEWRRAASEARAPRPHYYSFDHGNQTMLLGYVDGVPIDLVLGKGKEYGLSDEQIQKVKTHFRKQSGGDGSNFVLDLNEGHVVRIDAY